MRAEELMIGDLVGRVFDDKRKIEDYGKVDWVRTGEVGIQYNRTWSIGCIEPIPLTAEILEKNGLDKVPELSMVLNRDTMPMYHSPMLHYVHELQHALRLCGLDELADNFKV